MRVNSTTVTAGGPSQRSNGRPSRSSTRTAGSADGRSGGAVRTESSLAQPTAPQMAMQEATGDKNERTAAWRPRAVGSRRQIDPASEVFEAARRRRENQRHRPPSPTANGVRTIVDGSGTPMT